MKEHSAAQVWLFDDPDVDDRWVVYLVEEIEFGVVRSRVLAAAEALAPDYDVGDWLCFQHGSWIDQNSRRIT